MNEFLKRVSKFLLTLAGAFLSWINPSFQKRRDEFIKYLAIRVGNMDVGDDLLQNEKFKTAVTASILIAMRTHQ